MTRKFEKKGKERGETKVLIKITRTNWVRRMARIRDSGVEK